MIDNNNSGVSPPVLDTEQQRVRIIIEHMPVMLCALDNQSRFVFWNRECERVTGYSSEDILSHPDAMALLYPDPDYRQTVIERRAHFAGFYRDWEITLRCKNGEQRTISWSNLSRECPIPGWTSWAIGIDVTDKHRQEEERQRLSTQLMYAQKLESLGVLAGGIAHDFNNLLVSMLGHASLALEDLPENSTAHESIGHIETAAMRAADLCKQMLAYSGKGRFVVQRLNLSELIEEMSHLLQVTLSKKIVLRLNLMKDLPAIEADSTQIRQVIMNLISNASEAAGEKSGFITITTGLLTVDREYLATTFLDDSLTEGRYTFLEISDTGAGMDEATRNRVFEPFFTTKAAGRGLGLAAVLGIVRGHKGAIKLYSEPMHGTTVKIMLPSISEPAEKVAERKTPASPVKTGTILVVDDEEGVRTFAQRALQRQGFKVLVAKDGREGVDVYRLFQDEIVLVLLDMTMPNLNGEDAFREMRTIREDVRVILSSGYNEQEATNRFIGKRLAGFIQKPYRPTDLFELIDRILQQPATPAG